jgi:hypothetical protein
VINCAINGFSELCFRKLAIKRYFAFNPGAIRLRPPLSKGWEAKNEVELCGRIKRRLK